METHLVAWMWLVGSAYNWCSDHNALARELPLSPRKRFWVKRTPAMAARLTDHRWSMSELLWCKHPTTSRLATRLWEAPA